MDHYLCPIYEKDYQDEESETSTSIICSVCMGLWQSMYDQRKIRLQAALQAACEPYGGIANNRFARLPNQGPSASFAGDILLRYKYFAEATHKSENWNGGETTDHFSVYQRDLKRHIYSQINDIVRQQQGKNTAAPGVWDEQDATVASEEQGYLAIHVLCLPPKNAPLLLQENNNKKKKSNGRRQRPFITQGGDPRRNLEARLESQGYRWISQAMADNEWAQRPTKNISTFLFTPVLQAMEYHVIVFRRPMYLYGFYTKSRRDVSQSPFVVMRDVPDYHDTKGDNGDDHCNTNNLFPNKRQNKRTTETLGVTSVEEQICGPIETMVGISTLNNPPPPPQKKSNNLNNSTNESRSSCSTLYGMIKFHASGREDLDVRMLVRSNSPTCVGRPFCIQIIDALRPISRMEQLAVLTHAINHTTATTPSNDGTAIHHRLSVNNPHAISYGQNPMGVGVAPDHFQLVPSTTFSGLQESTETKLKHYGCYCWSQKTLMEDRDLQHVLFGEVTFPLTINQRTPLRVLHRRSNLERERHILAASAKRLDDHHFWLSLTTAAGTYVKEFVHGDLGRTKPTISSLMGSRTCLLNLDCEGIEMSKDAHNMG